LGYYSSLVVSQPGGISNASGSPGFLIDLSNACYQASWTDLMQGGLEKAEFDLRMTYESTLDLIFGNWITYSCLGGFLASNAIAGSSTLTVGGIQNAGNPNVLDLAVGDSIMVADGTNYEFYTIANMVAAGGSNFTLTLGGAVSNTRVNALTTLTAAAAAGASSITIASLGSPAIANGNKIVIGQGSTAETQTVSSVAGFPTITLTGTLANAHSIGDTVAKGSGAGATALILDSNAGIIIGTVITIDVGPNAETKTITSISGTKQVNFSGGLANTHQANCPVTFTMPAVLQNSFTTGSCEVTRVQYQGYITQRNRATPQGNMMSIMATGFFSRYGSVIANSDATTKDGATLIQQVAESYAGTIQPIIVSPANFNASSTPVNMSATDTTVSEIMADIMRQENGGLNTSQYLTYVDATRQIYHGPFSTVPVYTAHSYTTPAPTQYLSLADQSQFTTLSSAATSGSPTLHVVSAAQLQKNQTIRVDAELGVIGTIAGTTITLTANLAANHASGASVLAPYGDTIGAGGIQTTDMDGTALMNAAIVTGASTSAAASSGTNLTAATIVTQTVFSVLSVTGFEAGQTVLIGVGGGHVDTLTIQSVNTGANQFTTTTGALNTHLINGIVQIAPNSANDSSRIIVEQSDSIAAFGWFEGTLSSEDITDEGQLAAWAGKQLSLTGWPALKATVSLDTTSCRIDGRDLLSIAGFSDGSILVGNVASVQYTAMASTQNVSAQISLGIMSSTHAMVMRQIGKERVVKHKYHVPGVPPTNENMVVYGFVFLQTGTNTFTISAGRIKYQGTIIDFPAFSGTAPNGETRYGANASTDTVTKLPSRNWNGRDVYAKSVYQIASQGTSPVPLNIFLGLPLYRVDVKRGAINGFYPLFSSRGIGLGNHPPGPAQPIVSGSPTETLTVSANKTTCDLQIGVTWSNIPLDDTTHKIRYYKRTNGTTNGHLAHVTKIPGLPLPSSPTLTDNITIQGIPNGQIMDFGASYEAHNGESTINWFITGYTVGANSMPSSILSAGPGISSCVVTQGRKKGTLRRYSIAWTETDFNSNPSWLDRIVMCIRFNGDTDSGSANNSRMIEREIDPARLTYSTNGTMTNILHAPAGETLDVGFYYVDMTGRESTEVWSSSGNSDADGDFFSNTTVADSGGLFNTVHPNRHKYGVRNAIGDTADIFSSTINYGQVHRLHIDENGSPGAFNELYDPSFTKSLTSPSCPWVETTYGGTATVAYATDTFAGGRGKVTLTGAATGVNGFQQTVTVFNGQQYVASGVMFASLGGVSGAQVGVAIRGATTATLYANFVLTANSTGVGTPWFVAPFTVSGDTALLFQCYVNNGVGSGTVAGLFQKNQLEANSQPSPWSDHYAGRGHNQSHDASANCLNHMFGPISPVVQRLSDSALLGFSTTGVSSVLKYSTANIIAVHADVTLPNTSTQVGITIGNLSNGIMMYQNGTTVGIGKWVSGSFTVYFSTAITTVANVSYRWAFAVNFNMPQVEFRMDASGQGLGTAAYHGPASVTLPTVGANAPINIVDQSGGSTLVQNLLVKQQELFLEQDISTQGTINATTSGFNNLASGVAISAAGASNGPCIVSGSGVPSAAFPKGSVYLNLTGGVGTHLYVSNGGGTWNAVAGV
jgi:hypothetical protein